MRFYRSALFAILLVLLTLMFAGSSAMAKSPAKVPVKTEESADNNADTQASSDPVTGLWMTQDRDGGVELYTCDMQICGRLYWLKNDEENGDVSRDKRNPDPDKQDQPLCGMQFMSGFVPDGKGHYTEGTIYSPRHGANFSAEMTLADHNTLNLRGYMLFSFLGETQTWRRATILPKCQTTSHKPAGQ